MELTQLEYILLFFSPIKETRWKYGGWISISDSIEGTRKGDESPKAPKQL